MMKTEEKAKVVATVGGKNLFNPCLAGCFALGRFEEQEVP